MITNGIIESATITNDEHGILSAWVFVDYGGSGQGFGGYVLYLPKDFSHSTNQRNYAGHFIWRVMEAAGVSEWSKLKGRAIRIEKNAEYSGPIIAIGHIIKDVWFNPKTEFEQMKVGNNQPARSEI